IRVFLGRPDGRFDREPSYTHSLKLISPRDHSRGSGSVITTARDVDSNGLLDLIITHVEGTFSDTVTTTYFYRNRDGRWDLANPDDKFVSDGTFSSDLLLDIDGDEVDELVRIQFRFSVLELVEILLTRKIDSVIAVHRLLPDGRYDTKPSSSKKFSTGISFETFRPKGFMPQAGIDINADGLMDVITSANGKGIEVYLGAENEPFEGKTAEQEMSTTGSIRFADFDDDGLLDFVLYDSQSFDAPVQTGRNLGVLPNSATN
ncbi:MAG: FG-GAP-like repeat-containing protein, partial [Woeseiaceae bacterium]